MRAPGRSFFFVLSACVALACGEESTENPASNLPAKGGAGGSSGSSTGGSTGQGGVTINAGNNAGKAVVLELKLENENWNSSKVETGKVRSVVEFEGRTILFGELGAQVLAGGAVAAHDESIKGWRSAGVIPAADGPGSWVAGLDDKGTLHRLTNLESLEPISERYGLAAEDILAFASGDVLVFALKSGLAVADGAQVVRHDLGAVSSVITRKNWVGALLSDSIVLLDVDQGQGVSFAVSGARALSFDDDGRLIVATDKALLAQAEPGSSSALLEVFSATNLGSLAQAGGRTWFTAGSEVGTFEPGVVAVSKELKAPEGLVLIPSSSGGVWAAGQGAPLRFSLGGGSADEKQWQATVQPAFARSCSSCHLPGGTGGRDLSTYAAWVTHRTKINERVVVKKNMPPPGDALSQDDFDAIAAWCASSP